MCWLWKLGNPVSAERRRACNDRTGNLGKKYHIGCSERTTPERKVRRIIQRERQQIRCRFFFQRITARIFPPLQVVREIANQNVNVRGGQRKIGIPHWHEANHSQPSADMSGSVKWPTVDWNNKKTENLAIPHGNHCENYTILQCRNWLVSIEILKQTKK